MYEPELRDEEVLRDVRRIFEGFGIVTVGLLRSLEQTEAVFVVEELPSADSRLKLESALQARLGRKSWITNDPSAYPEVVDPYV